MSTVDVAIVGATGLVGSVLLSILEERQFPIGKLYLLASSRSSGGSLVFAGKSYPILDLTQFDFSQSRISFFAAGNDISEKYAPIAAKAGNVVIDKSSQFRYEEDVPLVVPEVNPEDVALYKKRGIIASPNCNMTPIAVALKPIDDYAGITRINVATYQSVSGSGKDAILELKEQSRAVLDNQPIVSKVYPQQIAFNVIPHIDQFEENAYTREEMKIVWELRRVFHNPSLAINPTAVRVPVFCGHSAAVHIETRKKISVEKTLELLRGAKGVHLITGDFPYPTPLKDAASQDGVFVGRVREDISHPQGLDFWIVADNLRKGAALNAVQIAEILLKTSEF